MKRSLQKTAIILLAAGASSRMGAIKQLLPWKHTTLIGHAIEQALNSNADDVYVILGANYKLIFKEIEEENITIIDNKNWLLGMGTSIASVMEFILEKDLKYNAVLIGVIDQPLVDVKCINKLINSYIENTIIASKHQNIAGVPAIFGSNYFDELKSLNGNIGARELIAKHINKVKIIDFFDKIQDVDSRASYDLLYQKYGKK